MQNRRSIADVVTEVRLWKEAERLSPREIAAASGANLSSVYRLLNDDTPRSRYGKALKAICKFANIRMVAGEPRSGEVPEVVRNAVMTTWDGTQEHAARLAAAIASVGELIRQALSSK